MPNKTHALSGTYGNLVWRASVNLDLLTGCGLLLRRQIRPRLRLDTETHHLVDIKVQQTVRVWRRLPHPNPISLLSLDILCRIKQHPRRRNKNIIKEAHRDTNTHIRSRQNFTHEDFTFEGSEDNHAEIDIDVYDAGAVADKTFAGLEYVVEGYAEAYAVDYFVGVFGVDIVFDCLRAALFEVLR